MSPDIHTLTGAYAVDALPEEERRDFEEHLEVCEACRREVAELRETAAHLGAATAEAPPAHLRDAVLGQIDDTRQRPPRPAAGSDVRELSSAPGWRNLPRRLVLAPAAAIVLVLGVGVTVVVTELNDQVQQLEATSEQVAEILAAPDLRTATADGPAGSRARVVAAPSRGQALFTASGLPAAGPDRTYQLWMLEGERAVPAGVFDAAESEEPLRIVAGDLDRAGAIAVTEEPAGGSEQPTSDPILVAELAGGEGT